MRIHDNNFVTVKLLVTDACSLHVKGSTVMLCTIFAPIPCVALYAFFSCHLMFMRGKCVRYFFLYALPHHNVIYSKYSYDNYFFFLDKLDILMFLGVFAAS